MQRILHEPTIRLKGLGERGDSAHGQLQLVRELFGLEGSAVAGDSPAAGDDAVVADLDAHRRASS
jgi:hypothetical protein